MRAEEVDERWTVGHRPAHLFVALGAEMRQQGPHVDDAALDQLGRLEELRLEGQRGLDRPQCELELLLVERRVERGVEELVLVGEDPEDGAFGDAGCVGDLLGGDRFAVLGEQRADRFDDRRSPLLGGIADARLAGVGVVAAVGIAET